MTPKDVLKMAKEKGARIVDLRFIDLPGLWQHFSIPVSELKEDIFEDGLGFDGSSIRGFQSIDESDMLLIPDPTTAQMDPFTAVPTMVLICNVKDPVSPVSRSSSSYRPGHHPVAGGGSRPPRQVALAQRHQLLPSPRRSGSRPIAPRKHWEPTSGSGTPLPV